MVQGGDAYLPSAKVRELLIEKMVLEENFITEEDWKNMEIDLEAMKDFAKKAVERLTVNHLMIDPVAEKLLYLTCVEVRVEDYPWT